MNGMINIVGGSDFVCAVLVSWWNSNTVAHWAGKYRKIKELHHNG